MSAKVIQLSDFKKGYRAPTGVVFPELYRLEGDYFDLVEGSLTPSQREAPVGLVLSELDADGLANPRWTPLKRLDPSKDRGWAIVRHHMQRTSVEGYFDALCDLGVIKSVHLYQTREGLFSLLRRPAPPNCPDHLLIYISKGTLQIGPAAGSLVDNWQIVHPDGSVSDDFDAVSPWDEEDIGEG